MPPDAAAPPSHRPPAEILDGLRAMGLLPPGAEADRRAARRRRVVRHLAGRRCRPRPDLREARAAEAEGRGGLARAGDAQPLRGALDAARRRGRAGCGAAACSARTRRRARWRWNGCRPADHPLWKAQLRDGHADPAFAARWRTPSARIHAATAADPAVAGEFPTDAIFHAIRLEPYLVATARAHPRPAPRRWTAGGVDRGDQARAGAWRRQPEEHPGGAAWPGVPRCGMRLVGRSGLRPRLLPQPPAAEMPVDAAARAPASSPASTRSPPPTWRAWTGSRRRRVEARAARLLPGPVPGARGRQVPGRVPHRRGGQGPRAARRARRCCSRAGRCGSARCATPGRRSWTR